MDALSATNLEFLGVLVTTLGSFSIFIWKKLIKPSSKLFESHEELIESVEVIKHEVITNTGKSLKDVVNSLRGTCENIEKGQMVIEQRSRAALHYNDQALFETDKDGKLTWTNESFYELTGETLSEVEGYDWLTYIKEGEREKFLNEFTSCIEMNRKLEIETINSKDELIRMVGYPYKINDSEHDGFLVNIYSKGE